MQQTTAHFPEGLSFAGAVKNLLRLLRVLVDTWHNKKGPPELPALVLFLFR